MQTSRFSPGLTPPEFDRAFFSVDLNIGLAGQSDKGAALALTRNLDRTTEMKRFGTARLWRCVDLQLSGGYPIVLDP